MASIFRHKNKHYYVQFLLNGIRLTEHAGKDKAKAHLHLAFIENELSKVKQGKKSQYLLDKLCARVSNGQSVRKNAGPKIELAQGGGMLAIDFEARWLQEAKLNKSQRTIDSYMAVWNAFKVFQGEQRFVGQMTTESILAFMEWAKGEGKSIATLNKYQRTLKAIFNWGIEQGLLKTNPVKVKASKVPKQFETFLYPSEAFALIDAAREISEGLWLFVAIGYFTGARRSEILGLTWHDVEGLEAAKNYETFMYGQKMTEGRRMELVVEMYKNVPHLEGMEGAYDESALDEWARKKVPQGFMYFRKRKGGKFNRVPIHPMLRDILLECQPKQSKMGQYIVKPEYVNIPQSGIRWAHSREYARAVEGAKLEGIIRNGLPVKVTAHTLRYSFCSLLLTCGLPQDVVMRYACHSTVEMNMHYANLMFSPELLSKDELAAIKKTFLPFGV